MKAPFSLILSSLVLLFLQTQPIRSNSVAVVEGVSAVATSGAESSVSSAAGNASAAVPTAGAPNSILGSPSAFTNTHLSHTPWNFTAPNLLFHPSKTINDGSCFSQCRLVNIAANLKRSIKSKIFGIFDEREFIASGVPTSGIPIASGSVVACGVHSQLPVGCLQFVGTGYVLLEEHSSTEAALVSLARMAGGHGANLVGNVNCGFTETIRGTSATASLGASTNELKLDGERVGLAAGLSAGRTVVERPSKPNCSADFFIAGANRSCYGSQQAQIMKSGQTYMPMPLPQRRYLPPAAAVLPSSAPVQRGQMLPLSAGQVSSQSVVPGRW